MFRIVYFLYKSLIWLLTLPPIWVLQRISDLLFILVYFVFAYRKKVTFNNLRRAFPEKNENEIKLIAKKFYRHLCDTFVESTKSLHFSKKQLQKRFELQNPELLNNLFKAGKNVVLVSGHYGNWEWAIHMPSQVLYKHLVIYHPLLNPYADKLINTLRAKGGYIPVPMKEIFRKVIEYKRNNELILTWFLADQRPPRNSKFWTTFLNQDTAFYLGAEKIAQKTNASVVLMNIQKHKRGYYKVFFDELVDKPTELHEFEITNRYIKKLESIIREKPEYWLWSHKRWKHNKPQDQS